MLTNILFTSITLLLGIPVLWFCIQVIFACLPRSSKPADQNTALSGRIVVLVPAHNESTNVIPTLRAVLSEKDEFTRILLVADNCDDDTAEIARHEDVEVIERRNPELRGKGYALDFGIQHLKANPPEVVIVLDADCLPEKGALQTLASLALVTLRPVQALYLMKNADVGLRNNSLKAKIAAFAWVVKNHVRPRGLHRLGLPCQLTGSGMAFPWAVLQKVSLANGNIVEDMKLGMALAALGHPPLFSEHSVVNSNFPGSEEGVQSQRTRWEHGHLAMLLDEGLSKLVTGLLKRDWNLMLLALDLCIPPLALLAMGLFVWEIFCGIYWGGTGNITPFLLGFAYLAMILASVTLAWSKFGRHIVSARELLTVPVYLASKLPVYASFLWRRQSQWVRSKRDSETK